MKRTSVAVFALCLCILAAIWKPVEVVPVAHESVLAADNGVRWYRGNLHTHTLWSDGDDYPEMVAKWYRDQGYDFLSFTDHNTLLDKERWIDIKDNKGGENAYNKLRKTFPRDWIQERLSDKGRNEIRLKTFSQINAALGIPGQFLLIQGEEVSDKYGGLPVHMNVANVQTLIPPQGGDSVYEVMQRNTDAAIAQREKSGKPMMIHLNHPNFGYAVRAEDLMQVRGENFFEVYNGHPGVSNLGSSVNAGTERIWDVVLTRRIAELKLPIMYGLAVDDGHDYHVMADKKSNPGRGWVMVLCSELTTPAIINSLEKGLFYSSSGVSLREVRSSAKGQEVIVAPENNTKYVIEFIGTKKGYPTESEPVIAGGDTEIWTTRRYSPELGKVLHRVEGTHARYDFADDDLYVRARVTSSKLHPNPSVPGEFERAWAQPVLGPAAPNNE